MIDLTIVAVCCVIHDRVAGMDTLPQLYNHDAEAMRAFKKGVNMPSDSMFFHSPGDFEITKIGVAIRDDDGKVVIVSQPRDVLLTGTAAISQDMRDSYLRLSQSGESKHAPEQISQHS